MSNDYQNTIAITVITLVAGLGLGVVQEITADPIARTAGNSGETEAYKTVFADADSFESSGCG